VRLRQDLARRHRAPLAAAAEQGQVRLELALLQEHVLELLLLPLQGLLVGPLLRLPGLGSLLLLLPVRDLLLLPLRVVDHVAHGHLGLHALLQVREQRPVLLRVPLLDLVQRRGRGGRHGH
jgi:hypothetical protein